MATCTSTTTLTVQIFASSSCSGTATTTKKINATTQNVMWSCANSLSSSMEISLGLSGCSTPLYASIDTCTPYGSYYSSYSCLTSSSGAFKVFSNSSCSVVIKQIPLNSTCYGALSVSTGGSTFTIDATLTACNSGAPTTSTAVSGSMVNTTTGSSSGNMIGLKNIMAIFVMIAFMIANL